MKPPLISTLFAAVTLLVSCQNSTPPIPTTPAAPPWLNTVDQEVHKLGTFNWVIIAEPSFPALSRSGVTTITTPVSTTEALDGVLQSIDSHSHVRPRIHLTREAGAIIEHDTPGFADDERDYDQIEQSGRLAREGVLNEDLHQLAAGIFLYHESQLNEGMTPLPEISGSIAKKYCGGGHGGYALYLFESSDQRDSAVAANENIRPVEPYCI